MKPCFLMLFLTGSLWQPAACSRADDLFNPSPAQVESPRDDAGAVRARLTANTEGKTPIIKSLDSASITSLADRGEPTLYTKANSHDFAYLGMPVGGTGAGEIYLSGDGRLWDWDIFGTRCRSGFPVEQGLAYASPHQVNDMHDRSQQVVDEGFVIRTRQGARVETRTLDNGGFANVTFLGQYPLGLVDYADPASPVRVQLEAFSPFIPSDVPDSTYPATILSYTVENTSRETVECTVGGWMENAAGIDLRNDTPVQLENAASKGPGYTALNLLLKEAALPQVPPKTFDNFESGKYDHWTAEGDAFGNQPARLGEIQHSFPLTGVQGQYLVDTYLRGDAATGKLTSASFVIERRFVTFLIGGGKTPRRSA